jgi:hypothetical protein
MKEMGNLNIIELRGENSFSNLENFIIYSNASKIIYNNCQYRPTVKI